MADPSNIATVTLPSGHEDRDVGDGALANVLEQVADELKANGEVDLRAWQSRFPELASEIQRLMPTLEALAEFSSAGGPAAPLDDDEFRFKTLGDFRIVRELGRGGMGLVYEAEQFSLNRRVALKILPTAAVLDPRTLQRFKNEAQAAAALDHPHIVDVYGIGCERGVHYYAMRLIDGCTLADVISELAIQESGARVHENETRVIKPVGGSSPAPSVTQSSSGNLKSQKPNPKSTPTTPLAFLSTVRSAGKSQFYRLVAELGIHVASGLDHAHSLGVIHRDIKPSNLMIDGQGKVWITDFGLAHIEANQTLTVSGDLIGTLRYMSPEQALANRAPVDHRTDIYSLGATLYELVTGRPVFGESDRASLLAKIALTEPFPPRKFNPHIPADLETIVLKMLEKDPGSRYASAAELAADLGRFVENKPITARRPSWRIRLTKWSTRNRSLVGTIAVTLLLVSAIVGGIFGWWGRDNAAHRLIAESIATEAWDSAAAFADRKKWRESLVELKRAEAALSAQPGTSELQQRITANQADATMVLRLDEIRLGASAMVNGGFDYAATDAAYAKAFSDRGIDALGIPWRKLAAQVQASPIGEELAAALTNWSIVRFHLGGVQDPHRLPLLSAAKLADPDPFRDSLRQAWKRSKLMEMATTAALDEVSASSLHMLIEACTSIRVNDQPVQDRMREIQRFHAADFWINHSVAFYFANTQPPQLDDAIRYYSVAIALQPDAAAAHNNLGVFLVKKGRRAEAIAEFRRAIELEPDFALAVSNLEQVMSSPALE